MKPSISISTFKPRFSPITLQAENLTEFERLCSLAKRAGYKGVDLFIDKKASGAVEDIHRILARNDLHVAMLICIYLSEQGVFLTPKAREDRLKACDAYIEQMRIAKALKADTMPIGLLRGGYQQDDTPALYQERLAESCRILGAAGEENGIRLCIEPINRYEIDTLNTVPQTLEFLERNGLFSLWVVPDLFHMNIEDTDICGTLKMVGKRIGHMHVSDSNRKAPGMGNLNYRKILRTLKDVGYDGFLTLETLNQGQTEQIVNQGARYLEKILTSIE